MFKACLFPTQASTYIHNWFHSIIIIILKVFYMNTIGIKHSLNVWLCYLNWIGQKYQNFSIIFGIFLILNDSLCFWIYHSTKLFTYLHCYSTTFEDPYKRLSDQIKRLSWILCIWSYSILWKKTWDEICTQTLICTMLK